MSQIIEGEYRVIKSNFLSDPRKARGARLADLRIHLREYDLAAIVSKNAGRNYEARDFTLRAKQVRGQISNIF